MTLCTLTDHKSTTVKSKKETQTMEFALNSYDSSVMMDNAALRVSSKMWSASSSSYNDIPSSPQRETNNANHYSRKQREVEQDEVENEPRTTLFQNQDKEEELARRVADLTAKIEAETKKKEALKLKCQDFDKENHQLKRELQDQRKDVNKTTTGRADKAELERQREARWEQRTLVQGPLWEHMHSVNRTYDIKNQHFVTNKTHFDLSIPARFQRVATLNARDKAQEEKEAAIAAARKKKDMEDAARREANAPKAPLVVTNASAGLLKMKRDRTTTSRR
jgi:hypothetical protein